MFYVDKLYDHTLGLSACFRQPFAESHCREPHGYALAFRFKFGAEKLDRNNWVIDFGGLKPIKQYLFDTFDHRTILAENDPFRQQIDQLWHDCKFTPPVILPFVGCEGFAHHMFKYADAWLDREHVLDCDTRGLHLAEVEVREHGGNSATYTEKYNG